ncbi:MAG: response regulator [Archangiaceae bacterium]|nr:response regulator [Archangiaceae bacterium]
MLDTGPDDDFKAITDLASLVLECPIALVGLIAESRVWFKAKVGLAVNELPRSSSFCAHAILSSGEPLVVEDARRDPRFHDNPLVAGAPHVAFYAGVPLVVGGLPVGTLCVIDDRPRTPTSRQLKALVQLARQTEVLLEACKTNRALEGVARQHRESEEQLRAVVHSMHDGMVMHDRTGAIVWNNPSAWRILGLTEDQLKGRTSFDPRWRSVHPDGTPFVGNEHPAMVVLATNRPVRGVVMGVGVGDELRWIRINGEPLFRPGETVCWAAVASFTDITELRRREEDLSRAVVVAEQASRAKSEFLATMSHELRTPMNGVIGMSELLLADSRDDERTSMLTTIRDSGRSLLSIIDDLLDYSKIEAGGRHLAPEPCAPGAVASGVLQLLAAQAKKKGLTVGLEAHEVGALADVDALRQVLVNLVGNALKFTSTGHVTVRVFERAGRCRIEVSDTGIGLTAEQLPRLFQRFSQAESTTTRRFGGTGLGLAICKRLVEGMQGTIGVESIVGVGSTFWFTLPAAALCDIVKPQTASVITPLERALHVLLVEDNVVNQRVSAGMLKRLGHLVVVVDDGRKALEAVERQHFDVVLMDVQMPEMDGLEATRAIRTRGGLLSAIPIIALTASVLKDERLACFEAGMNDVLAKPLTLDALRDAMTRMAA